MRLAAAVTLAILIVAASLRTPASAAAPEAVADVVVIVDTSASMKEPGMDPGRVSFLLTKLLSDIVPGHLAVMRFLDSRLDKADLPSRPSGRRIACPEGPGGVCDEVIPAIDWEEATRKRTLGALVRARRADPEFRAQLDRHLEQRARNSMFRLAFRGAQGVFDGRRASSDVPRTIVWLSDGRPERPEDGERTKQIVTELIADGTRVEAIVFGRGDTRLAKEAGLVPRTAASPAELMQAFAAAFRRIVDAPREVNGDVAGQPAFEMMPAVDEAWIVVYGDETLRDATVDGPRGAVLRTDYAHDSHSGAGAYRVAYTRQPTQGRWTVRAVGGGRPAYAVIQRSALAPVLLSSKTASAGVSVPLVVGIQTSDGRLLAPADLPPGLSVEAEIDGRRIALVDDGQTGDSTPRDGRYSATTVFNATGRVTVTIRARSNVMDRTVRETVDVTSVFRYTGGLVAVDLGRITHEAEGCRDVRIAAEHVGDVPFELKVLRALPAAHRLEIRTRAGVLHPDGARVVRRTDDPLTVCLVTGRAASSQAAGEPWLEMRVASVDAPTSRVVFALRWQVDGLSWWQRWGWLVLLIAGLVALAAIVYGWIKPYRFGRAHALIFVADERDLDEQTPQPLAQWRDVGIGWYRDARGYLHGNFRVSGKRSGALASLRAARAGTIVAPENGNTLYRDTMDGWEAVAATGRHIRPGETYRVGERGPYFRASARAG